MPNVLKPSLNWLLPLTPVAIVMRFVAPEAHIWLFFLAGVAIIPIAGWMGKATEHLAARTGEGIGGLLNATFGNMAELIIAIMALRKGLPEIVKASLTGSIIGNALLILGASMLAGGLKFKTQEFNPAGGRTRATQLTLAAIALLIRPSFIIWRDPRGPRARARCRWRSACSSWSCTAWRFCSPSTRTRGISPARRPRPGCSWRRRTRRGACAARSASWWRRRSS